MLENEPKVRPYLREIIPSLLSLKNMIGMNQNNLENRDESQQIKQVFTETSHIHNHINNRSKIIFI